MEATTREALSSLDATIRRGVAENVMLQAHQTNALDLGVDRTEAFDESVSHHDHDAARIIALKQESNEHEGAHEPPSDSELAAESSIIPLGVPSMPSKKRKSKKRSKSQRQVTGFEEYYVDPPLTPEQHTEELSLYTSSRPFMERIEIAIQRYTAKRNLDKDRKNLFDKYLKFGGIDSGPKMFSGGLDNATLADSSAAEIAILRANHTVPIERGEDSVVDFERCLKAFLSSPVMFIFDLNEKTCIEKHIGVISNFLNYLLRHDVCPEYQEQIQAARRVCVQAEAELWSIVQAQSLLPGSFNKACSELFGGAYQGKYDPTCVVWMSNADKSSNLMGLTREKAGRIFTTGFAAYGTDEQLQRYKETKKGGSSRYDDVARPYAQDLDLEILEIKLGRLNTEITSLYQSEQAKDLPIIGIMKTRTWNSPMAMTRDLTYAEEERLLTSGEQTRELIFWVDDALLEKLRVGMYLEATVKELNFGVCYFDEVQTLRPTFFTFLANEQMLDWRKVEDVWIPPRCKEVEANLQERQESAQGLDNS